MANSRTRSQAAALGWVTRRANIAAREAEAEHERRSAAAILGHQRRKARLAEKASAEAIAQPAKKKKAVSKKRPAKKPAEKKPAAKKRPAKKKAIAKKKAAKKAVAKKRPAKKAVAKKPTARKPSAPAEPAKPAKPAEAPSPAKKRPAKKRPAKKRPAKKRPAKKRPAKKRPTRRKPKLTAEQWAEQAVPSDEEWTVDPVLPGTDGEIDVESIRYSRRGLTLAELEENYNDRKRDLATLIALALDELEGETTDPLLYEKYTQGQTVINQVLRELQLLIKEGRKTLADKKASAELPRSPTYRGDIAWEDLMDDQWAKYEEALREATANTEMSKIVYAINKSDLNTSEAFNLIDIRSSASVGRLNDRIQEILSESNEFTDQELYTLYFTSLTP